jgi:hypothetical protein
MLTVRARVLEAGSKNWLPILVLNGTSVETGRRIITSDVSISWSIDEAEKRHRPFRDAYDFRDMIAPTQDIRLSTAATMSARFPIVSPHGNIRDANGRIVDRVVDGGYFENFGASTAAELGEMLEQRYDLKPAIILINNEPSTSSMECVESGSVPKASDQISQTLFLSGISAPLYTVLGTREARGTYDAVQLCHAVGPDRFAYVTVYKKDSISMSWWLSMNVQNYLDDHLLMEIPSIPFPVINIPSEFGEVGLNNAAFQKIETWQ